MTRPQMVAALGCLIWAPAQLLTWGDGVEPARPDARALPAAFCPPDPPPRVKQREPASRWEPDQRSIA